jgi:hypothetical protein
LRPRANGLAREIELADARSAQAARKAAEDAAADCLQRATEIQLAVQPITALLASSLFDDVAAVLREHGSATLDEHYCYFRRPEPWSAVTATCAVAHHGLPGDGYGATPVDTSATTITRHVNDYANRARLPRAASKPDASVHKPATKAR